MDVAKYVTEISNDNNLAFISFCKSHISILFLIKTEFLMLQHKKEMTEKSYYELKMMCIFVKLGSCSTLLKSLNSTLKVSIQKQRSRADAIITAVKTPSI